MPLSKIILKHKKSSVHNEPNGEDLKFRFLEQTKEVVSDKHLKGLFETGDKPTGVDFELFINSKVHQDDFIKAGQEIQNEVSSLSSSLKQEIANTSSELHEAISNLDEELSNEIFEADNRIKEELTESLIAHTTNADIHFTPQERELVAKFPELEMAINNLHTIVNGVARQHIVNTIEERDAIVELVNADICHVIVTQETYIYDLKNKLWIKVSDFNSLKSLDWDVIQNKPTEFNPTTHTHSIDDVENLRTMIEGAVGGDMSNFVTKDELGTYATKSELSSYPKRDELTTLATKNELSNYSTTNHNHQNLEFLDESGEEDTRFRLRRSGRDIILDEIYYNGGSVTHKKNIMLTSFGSQAISIIKDIEAPYVRADTVSADLLVVNNNKIFVSSTEPSNPSKGDIWIQI